MGLSGRQALTCCEGCRADKSDISAFWLVPFCDACAATRYDFTLTAENLVEWSSMASYIRQYVLSAATRTRYESIIRRAKWPLQSTLDTIRYIRAAATSQAHIKQAVSAAKKLHTSRGWREPPFSQPLVEHALQAIARSPVNTPTQPPITKVFSTGEIKALFRVITPELGHTHQRDAAILAIQLFGARRASEVLQLRMIDISLVEGHFQIRIPKSKTDQQGKGLFFRLPHDTALGVNPTLLMQAYISTHQLPVVTDEAYIFTAYHQYSKKFTNTPITVKDWNKRLAIMQKAAGIAVRTSHALRATAVSLSTPDDVHTVSQVGGWHSTTYLNTYHRTSITDRTRSLANIGSRILLSHAADD